MNGSGGNEKKIYVKFVVDVEYSYNILILFYLNFIIVFYIDINLECFY